MHVCRDMRNNKVALFDGIEEGGKRASSSYSHEIDEHENERAMEGLQDRVNLVKRLSGDIHEEVDSHNRMLDRMGNDMDSSRGILSGTMDKFKMVTGVVYFIQLQALYENLEDPFLLVHGDL
ncbi:Bet1-like SNARE 1-1 [Hibiscus syriacus]|uniref:Bet1-like SNARE 1-1 n=1 Tax=Hibiscus syriacus TaxID=106335 RepID=A0A6A2XK75_HIBSY|nr:Bet1-like SNARE 1-1 [Hibiscus syriacus]